MAACARQGCSANDLVWFGFFKVTIMEKQE
jgi:hypothetical protein